MRLNYPHQISTGAEMKCVTPWVHNSENALLGLRLNCCARNYNNKDVITEEIFYQRSAETPRGRHGRVQIPLWAQIAQMRGDALSAQKQCLLELSFC